MQIIMNLWKQYEWETKKYGHRVNYALKTTNGKQVGLHYYISTDVSNKRWRKLKWRKIIMNDNAFLHNFDQL